MNIRSKRSVPRGPAFHTPRRKIPDRPEADEDTRQVIYEGARAPRHICFRLSRNGTASPFLIHRAKASPPIARENLHRNRAARATREYRRRFFPDPLMK